MKVRVSPPYPGAGSFEVEADRCQGRFYLPETDTLLPASWCKEIPVINPEPGDICEFTDGHDTVRSSLRRYDRMEGNLYRDEYGGTWKNCRVLARKPKGGLDAHDAIHEFFRDLSDAETASADVAAYNKFLSAILGVPYGRVGG